MTTTRTIPSSDISGGQVDTQIERKGTERDAKGNTTEVHHITTLGPNGEHSEIWHRERPSNDQNLWMSLGEAA